MRFSVGLPTCMEGMMYPVPFITPEQIIEVAQHAEKLGYHSVWGNDHMTTQKYVRKEFSVPPNFWEVLITLTAIASHTTTLGVASGVLVPAMRRDIVVLAKQLATLDQFSQGRLMVGVGVGAYREEFEALQPGWVAKRSEILEEAIQCLQQLFTEHNSTWSGNYYHYQGVEMYPKPVQNPLPIYVGGNNPNSLMRAAKYGQAWLGAGMPVHQMCAAVKRLRQLAEEIGRFPENIEVAPQFAACIDRTHDLALTRFTGSQMYRHLVSLSGSTLKDQVDDGVKFEDMDLIGTATEIAERVNEYQAVGVDHICGILFIANSVSEFKDQMQWFAEEVISQF